MRGFLLGLLVGVALGGGAVYWWQSRPEAARGKAAAADAGATTAAAPARPSRRHRPRDRRGGDPGLAATAEETPIDEEIVLSAADLTPIWRGDSIRAPEHTVDFGAGEGGRALEQGEIEEGVARGGDDVTRCLVAARGQAPVTGAVTLELLVGGDGKVVRSRARAPAYLFAHGLEACARRAAGAMRFAATGASTVVTVPFEIR